MSSRSILASPTNERVRKLAERLHSIQSSFDVEKIGRVDLLEKKFVALEEQVEEFNQQTTLKLNDLRERVASIQKDLEADHLTKSDDLDLRLHILESLENRVHSAIDHDLSLRRDGEIRISKSLDERSSAFRSELLKETKAKNDAVDTLGGSFLGGLGKIQEGLKAAKADLIGIREDFVGKIEEESRSIASDVITERKSREDTEEAMLAMLKDVVGRIKSDLETERRGREGMEESLLGLLEDTCAKLKALTDG